MNIRSYIRQLSGVWSIKHSELYANFCSLYNIFRYKLSCTPSLLQILHILVPQNTCHRWLNSCSQILLHNHYSNNFNFSTVVILGFWLCQFNTSVLAWGLCLSSLTKFFVWLFGFNVCSLGLGWWSLRFEVHHMIVFSNLRWVYWVRGSVTCQCLTFLPLILVCQPGV